MKFHPGLEQFEQKRLLTSSPLASHVAGLAPNSNASALHSAAMTTSAGTAVDLAGKRSTLPTRFLAFRITNPTVQQVNLFPPFDQILVQSAPTRDRPGLQRQLCRREERYGPDFQCRQQFQGQTHQPIPIAVVSDPHGYSTVEAESMDRLLRLDQEVLSGLLRCRRIPARPRRRVINPRTGTVGEFSQAEI